MAEKKGKEEYQLPDEENLESHYEEDEIQYTEKPQKASFSPKDVLLNKKVLIPTVIVLGIYGLYKFMEYRDKQQIKAQQPTATAQQIPVTQPEAQNQTLPPQPAPSTNEALQATPDLQTMAPQPANQGQMQMETVATQVNQLQLVQTQMNTELNELNDTIKMLTIKLDQPQPSCIPPQPKVVKKVKKYYRSRVISGPSYHIRAVVPGRAWLVSSSGRLFTVRIGDRIAGLGVVENIDVIKGIVMMSSGREITYGKYDS